MAATLILNFNKWPNGFTKKKFVAPDRYRCTPSDNESTNTLCQWLNATTMHFNLESDCILIGCASEVTMNERRRFLQVLTGAVAAIGANCSATGERIPGGNGGEGGTGDNGGAGGTGSGMASSSSSSSSSSGTPCMPTGTNVGAPSKFATDGLYKLSGSSFLIGRDAGGLYAMTSLCTHQGCNLNSKGVIISGGIHCNCHGAEFDNNGAAVTFPAVNPLKHYQLTLECDGNLWVNSGIVVSSDVRITA